MHRKAIFFVIRARTVLYTSITSAGACSCIALGGAACYIIAFYFRPKAQAAKRLMHLNPPNVAPNGKSTLSVSAWAQMPKIQL